MRRRSRETARTDLAQGLNVALMKPYAVLPVKRHLDGTAARAARAFRQASIDERRPAPIKDCTCQLELPEIPRVAAPCLTVRGATRAEMRAQKPLARVFGDCLCSQHDVASLGGGGQDCLCSQHDAAGLGTATQDNSTVSIRAAWLHACSASMRRDRLVCRARVAPHAKLCQDDALKGGFQRTTGGPTTREYKITKYKYCQASGPISPLRSRLLGCSRCRQEQLCLHCRHNRPHIAHLLLREEARRVALAVAEARPDLCQSPRAPPLRA